MTNYNDDDLLAAAEASPADLAALDQKLFWLARLNDPADIRLDKIFNLGEWRLLLLAAGLARKSRRESESRGGRPLLRLMEPEPSDG